MMCAVGANALFNIICVAFTSNQRLKLLEQVFTYLQSIPLSYSQRNQVEAVCDFQ